MHTRERFQTYIYELQNRICTALEELDGKAGFEEDVWERPGGGGGHTRIIRNGDVFEKGGVNVSAVHGQLPEVLKQQLSVEQADFFACGLSLVLHPLSPMVPTVHANFRYFEMYDGVGKKVDGWFGGGMDLTPYYLWPEDAVHFHQTIKAASDPHGEQLYPRFKEVCDQYFFNKHRGEARGVGGVFFDYLKPGRMANRRKTGICSRQIWEIRFCPLIFLSSVSERQKPMVQLKNTGRRFVGTLCGVQPDP